MRRHAFAALVLFAAPAVAAGPAPDPAQTEEEFLEFLEFLAETAGEDEEFVEYIESRAGEDGLQRVERQASKGDDDE